MLRTILLSLALSGSALSYAAAEERHDWSGSYIGGVVSYHSGDNYWTGTGIVSTPVDTDGVLGGLTGGYNLEVGQNIVVGVELDISFGDMHSTSPTSASFGCAAGCQTEVDGFSTLRLRGGYAIGNTLPYFTAGVGFANATASVTGFGTLGDDTVSGLVFGIGVEHAFTPKITAKIEYLRADLGNLQIPTSCFPSCSTPIKFDVLRAGLNYNF